MGVEVCGVVLARSVLLIFDVRGSLSGYCCAEKVNFGEPDGRIDELNCCKFKCFLIRMIMMCVCKRKFFFFI